MNYTDNPQRRNLMKQVLDATTLPEIEAATQALRQWTEEHPDDLGIVDGFEQLALMRLVHQERAAQSSQAEASTAAEVL